MEEQQDQLTSLKDLKLVQEQKAPQLQDGKRKSRKLQQIKKQADDKKIYQNFTIKNKIKSKIDRDIILKSLSSHFIFSSLITEKTMQEMLLSKFALCKVSKGDYLMKQSDKASSFFILHQGKLAVQINGSQKRILLPGEGFGQLALLYSAPRSASIKALQPCYLWFIDRTTFRNAVETIIEKSFKQNRKFIESNKFFEILTPDQKDRIASVAISQKYEKKTKLVKEGDLASSMFILKSGKLRRQVKEKQIGFILPGESFDQNATLSKNSTRRETIVAVEDSQVIAFATQDIQNCLGNCLSIIVLRNKTRQALLQSGLFKDILPQHLERIIDAIKLNKVSKGDRPIEEGKPCQERIMLVIEGQYEIKGKKPSKTLFGVKSLTQQHRNENYDFTLIFTSDGKIAEFSRNSFNENVGMTYEELILRGKQFNKIIEKQEGMRHNIKNQAQKIKLQELQSLKKLGEGQFGVVHLVTDAKKQKLFALKCITKQETIKAKLQTHLLNEKQVLQSLTNPFVMGYIRSFKDANYIYFLTEFINGVELFDAIRIIGLLSLKQSRFYASLFLIALEAMHSKNIIYRDLKPQNAMVGEDGYLKIIDMGACKKICKTSASQKTFTIIGTPNYMAPEVLAGKGYTYNVDLWSLGVMLFEFMAGYVPFGQEIEDPYQIYEEILRKEIQFPKNMVDKNTNSFIKQLLDKKPQARLGGSYTNLKEHPFLQGVQWNALMERKVEAPFKLPKDQLVNVAKLMEQAKPLNKVLTVNTKVSTRKGLDPNWDSQF